MTKEEFKKQYCKKSEMTVRSFDKEFVVVPCICNVNTCSGWMVINNTKNSIKRYERFSNLRGRNEVTIK